MCSTCGAVDTAFLSLLPLYPIPRSSRCRWHGQGGLTEPCRFRALLLFAERPLPRANPAGPCIYSSRVCLRGSGSVEGKNTQLLTMLHGQRVDLWLYQEGRGLGEATDFSSLPSSSRQWWWNKYFGILAVQNASLGLVREGRAVMSILLLQGFSSFEPTTTLKSQNLERTRKRGAR